MVLTSQKGLVVAVHDAKFREWVWEMMRWDAIWGNVIYVEIVRSIVPQQIECVFEQNFGGGGCEGVTVNILNRGKWRGICNSRWGNIHPNYDRIHTYYTDSGGPTRCSQPSDERGIPSDEDRGRVEWWKDVLRRSFPNFPTGSVQNLCWFRDRMNLFHKRTDERWIRRAPGPKPLYR